MKKNIERKDKGDSSIRPGDSSIRKLWAWGEECAAQGEGKENTSSGRK